MRPSRLVLGLIAGAGVVIIVIGLGEISDSLASSRRASAFRTRGVTTNGYVMSVHYDANADPGGQTSLRLRYAEVGGQEHVVAVMHSGAGHEHVGGSVALVYDQLHPSRADLAANHPGVWKPGGLIAIGAGTAITGGGMTIVSLWLALRRRKPMSPSSTDPG